MVTETRRRLIDGAIERIRTQGIAGASARGIAGTAGVNQALVFYHFGSVDALIAEACQAATRARVARFRERLAAVGSLRELLAAGRALHAEERALGNVAVLAQVLAGAQGDPKLAGVAAAALRLWTVEIETVLTRLLDRGPLRGVADPAALASALAAGFVGIELLEGADPAGAAAAFDALDQLATFADLVAPALADTVAPTLADTVAPALGAGSPPRAG